MTPLTVVPRCPYCGEKNVDEEHLFACDPFARDQGDEPW